jgi:fructose-1,6-bisphosphatase/inositol monophosphatase family enzyme
VVLLSEAKGRATDFQGNPWKPQKKDLLFSNGAVHGELLRLLNQG